MKHLFEFQDIFLFEDHNEVTHRHLKVLSHDGINLPHVKKCSKLNKTIKNGDFIVEFEK